MSEKGVESPFAPLADNEVSARDPMDPHIPTHIPATCLCGKTFSRKIAATACELRDHQPLPEEKEQRVPNRQGVWP